MRFLNKIVFINSAHIRYAEVAVDGNVHFTGTQGVGKTTLLRALLFFYNCRKDRLGIRTQGQQAFDNFYVPTPESYIIYEVSRDGDEPNFSIILFRHRNRAAFRFVDAPYSKDWFIDSFGMVASDHLTVRQRIQSLGIDLSGIVERYAQYLDILYGNRNARLPKELLKYYLLKSTQYQNIPRIIQNVFLNERVDADFIKNTIISSISGDEEEIAVDLNFFRSKLIHFSDELSDISLWSAKNRQGIVETRRDADAIIGISRDIKSARFSLREQCGMLNHAMKKAEQNIPILQARISSKQEEVAKTGDRLTELKFTFEKDQKLINGRIAVLTRDLKKASELKKKYQQLGVDEMIRRAVKADALKLELHQKERTLAELTSSHKSISQKYETLRDRINLDRQQYLQSRETSKNAAESDFLKRQADRLKRKSQIESEIRAKFKIQYAEIDSLMASCRELLQQLNVQRAEFAVSCPLKQKSDACRRCIADSEREIHELTKQKLKEENRLEAIGNRLELDCQQLEAEAALQIKDVESRIDRLETLRSEEMRILEKAQGSLCEWLDCNVEGWEHTVGKVADEKDVLYAQNLNPKLIGGVSDSFFGISIDFDEIEKEVRSPSMIRESVAGLEKNIRALANDIIKIREEKDRRIAEAAKKIRTEQSSIRAEMENLTRKIQVCQRQAKEESLRLNAIAEEERKHVAEVVAGFDKKIAEAESRLATHSKERDAADGRCDAELRKTSKAFADEEKIDRMQKDLLRKSIDDDIAKYCDDCSTRLRLLEKDEAAELADSGADLRLIESAKSGIADVKSALERIDRERDTITIYRKYCDELLDHVPQMQTDRKKYEDDLANLEHKYDERRLKLDRKRKEQEEILSALRAALDKTLEAKKLADEFLASKSCPPDLKEISAVTTDLDCVAIISSIKDLTGEIYRQTDQLKESTNEFRKRFSQNNTFKFPTEFNSVEDYHRYAESLEEFVANDKIKEFQQVTSNLYRDILSRAANDFNILLGRESEIDKIIREINRDFENKTFAGVIRSITLRLDRSTMPIITQFQNITEFWNTHQYELGEINLFSSDEHSDINRESIKYLKSLCAALNSASNLNKLPLEQTFSLKFQIQENDNITDWVENIRAVGSEGTDILVKAIINILLISVFKKRAGQDADFRLHCMMDEIGRLADENIQGILDFANRRGIFVINSSPKAHRPLSFRRLYMLSKDKESNTIVQPILSIRETEML